MSVYDHDTHMAGCAKRHAAVTVTDTLGIMPTRTGHLLAWRPRHPDALTAAGRPVARVTIDGLPRTFRFSRYTITEHQ